MDGPPPRGKNQGLAGPATHFGPDRSMKMQPQDSDLDTETATSRESNVDLTVSGSSRLFEVFWFSASRHHLLVGYHFLGSHQVHVSV